MVRDRGNDKAHFQRTI